MWNVAKNFGHEFSEIDISLSQVGAQQDSFGESFTQRCSVKHKPILFIVMILIFLLPLQLPCLFRSKLSVMLKSICYRFMQFCPDIVYVFWYMMDYFQYWCRFVGVVSLWCVICMLFDCAFMRLLSQCVTWWSNYQNWTGLETESV